MTVYGAIFARGGSKGISGKNLREISGQSLLQIAIELGVTSEGIDRVLVSTDSTDISKAAVRAGAEVPFLRPSEMAGDASPEWHAWQHLVRHLLEHGASSSDTLVSLPATSPLRNKDDIRRAIKLFELRNFDLVLGVTETNNSPWFNMVNRGPAGDVSIILPPDGMSVTRRQDAPPTYNITTNVYVTSLGFVLSSSGIFSGRVGSILIPQDRAIDIDTELDLEIAQYLFKKRLSSGNG